MLPAEHKHRNGSTRQVMGHMSELMTTNRRCDREVAFNLFKDVSAARSRLWLEIVLKLRYFQQLPWCLLGMAHVDRVSSFRAAQYCLRMYDLGADASGTGFWHNQTQRFLSPTYAGTPQDPGLRKYVIKLAGGASIDREDMVPLCRMLARMRCIKMAERSVEGIHAKITKVTKHAHNCSMAYISAELRLDNLLEDITKEPQAGLVG